MNNPNDLEPLLSLNGIEYCIGADYWVKFSAIEIVPDEHRPFGVKYSLSMHNKYGTRLVGFDNAHLANIKRKNMQQSGWHGITNTIEVLSQITILIMLAN
jgi:hypothetical protein